MAKTRLVVELEYDPEFTDPESLATAMDSLVEVALSTPGILADYGSVDVGEFFTEDTLEPVSVSTLHGDEETFVGMVMPPSGVQDAVSKLESLWGDWQELEPNPQSDYQFIEWLNGRGWTEVDGSQVTLIW